MWELVCASGLWHGAPTHSVTASALTADLLVLLTADNEGTLSVTAASPFTCLFHLPDTFFARVHGTSALIPQ